MACLRNQTPDGAIYFGLLYEQFINVQIKSPWHVVTRDKQIDDCANDMTFGVGDRGDAHANLAVPQATRRQTPETESSK